MMFAIPKPILEDLRLKPDAMVGLTVADGRLIADPEPRKRYSLEELVAQCDPDAPLSAEDRDWLADEPKGREIL